MPDAHHTKKNKASKRDVLGKFTSLQFLCIICCSFLAKPNTYSSVNCYVYPRPNESYKLCKSNNLLPKTETETSETYGLDSSWWFDRPSNWIISPNIGVNISKHIWNHHLGLDCQETPDVHLKKCPPSHLSLWRSQRTAWWTSLLWSGQDHAHAFEDSRVHQPSQVPRL